jgi:LmbE family N-acetylglucosaminyl deacetylase
MFLAERVKRAVAGAAVAALVLAGVDSLRLAAQQAASSSHDAVPLATTSVGEANDVALPLPEDRGAAALEQALRRLSTTASVMMIVAHPDDEDGALLTYLSRGLGARVTLLTLTRGEGGQNAMGEDSYDALGLIRTNELLKADEYYGVKQLWGTEADFGFSKTQEEAFARWGHDRVLYDAVLAVRRERPQIIVSTFVGGVTDGHGHHQVSGEIAQEVFKAAGDPKVFPWQLMEYHLQPWQPLAVYSMTPFAPITEKGMFDYATGKWAPARFKNYVTGEWTEGALPADVTIQVGMRDPVLGRSYAQIAREGWGQQKSQYGGANPALSGPATTSYHLWAVAPEAAAKMGTISTNDNLFHNSKVNIDTSFSGLTSLVKGNPPDWLTAGLRQIDDGLKKFAAEREGQTGVDVAHKLTPVYRQAIDLRDRIATSDLEAEPKAVLAFELGVKINSFQAALKELLGLDLIAFRTKAEKIEGASPRGNSADETPSSVSPGEKFNVHIHATGVPHGFTLLVISYDSHSGGRWKEWDLSKSRNSTPFDEIAQFTVPDGAVPVHDSGTGKVRISSAQGGDSSFARAEPTQPYFSRPNIEQPYYDLKNPEFRLRSFAPYPLEFHAEATFDDLPIRYSAVVQTLQRVTGQGGVYQPLVVTPAIGVCMEPEARILPLDGAALPVKVMVHTEAAAEGTVELKLPEGWRAEPAEAHFKRAAAGDSEPILFSVTPAANAGAGSYTVEAVAHSGGQEYKTGWQSVGYPGLRPYNQYQFAQLQTRKVDVKLAVGLRVGYVMGSGDTVPEALEGLGVQAHLLTDAELDSSDLSAWNVIVIGIRAYSARPALNAAQPRLNEFVRNGGTLIVQYQSASFPAPLPLSLGRSPERVVDEATPVKLLEPGNALLASPNAISQADFDGWVEERGHSFAESWDSGFAALTETADAGQDPQRGGLLVAHPGKGTYIYVSYALYRQLPELVPGSYRLLANLLSASSK